MGQNLICLTFSTGQLYQILLEKARRFRSRCRQNGLFHLHLLDSFTLKFNIFHNAFYRYTARQSMFSQLNVVVHTWKDGQTDKQHITEEV